MEFEGLLLRLNKAVYQVHFYHPYIFIFVLGWISFFFAQVVRGHYVYMIEIEAIFFVPLQMLHVFIAAWVVLKATDGKPSLTTLFIAGSIIALHEGYITKEIWHPTWAHWLKIRIGGIAVVHTLILVFFFHSFFSVIIPLLVAETLMTNFGNKPIFNCLPLRIRYIFERRRNTAAVLLVLFVIWGGIYSSHGNHMPKVAFSGVTLLFIGILIAAWRYLIRKKEIQMMDMMPHWIVFMISVIILVLFYIAGALRIRSTKDIPHWDDGQLAVWLLYIWFFVMLAFNILYARYADRDMTSVDAYYSPVGEAGEEEGLKFSWWILLILSGIFLGFAIAFSYINPAPQDVIDFTLLGGVGVGMWIILYSLKQSYSAMRALWEKKPWRS